MNKLSSIFAFSALCIAQALSQQPAAPASAPATNEITSAMAALQTLISPPDAGTAKTFVTPADAASLQATIERSRQA